MKGAVSPIRQEDAEQDGMGMLLDQYLNEPRWQRGEVIDGVIVSVDSKTILIDIGGKCDAIVWSREVEQLTPQQLKMLYPGKPIKAYILSPADESGAVLVSLARAAQEDDWERARQLLESGEKISLPVVDINKGGVIVRLGRLRGFVPGSQLTHLHAGRENTENPQNRWESLLNQTLELRVIEVTPDRNRLIFSERPVGGGKVSRRKVLESLKVGTIEKGIVSNLVPFGAFVNVHGVDGLLHISELSWKRVAHPSEVLKPGQELQIYILEVDLENDRLGLSLKRLTPDPWEEIAQMYQEGQQVEVEIVNLTGFGAFAALIDRPSVEGLIHISELNEQATENPGNEIKVGDHHMVKIISLRPKERRIAFSLKQAATAEAPEPEALAAAVDPEPPVADMDDLSAMPATL